VLVGDTPNDVLAAREGGIAMLAVATGRSSEAELRAAGAEVVLPDLLDTDRVVDLLLG
jgi:phosphoglycolate phosphatase